MKSVVKKAVRYLKMESIIKFDSKECDRDGLVSVRQVAAKTSLSLATIYKAIKAGSLIAYTLANKYVLKPADVERWVKINQCKVIGVPQHARIRTTQRAAS